MSNFWGAVQFFRRPFSVAGTAGAFLLAKPEACGYPPAGEAAALEFFDGGRGANGIARFV
ncbi:hypothetical protein [Neisseria elongata]|uniref:hypothetical protein n=1 Tax=Neisseria elongata TaxID=495 RepID=UPI000D3C9F76|nr:hypothetical protein [Neisseria elongata]